MLKWVLVLEKGGVSLHLGVTCTRVNTTVALHVSSDVLRVLHAKLVFECRRLQRLGGFAEGVWGILP